MYTNISCTTVLTRKNFYNIINFPKSTLIKEIKTCLTLLFHKNTSNGLKPCHKFVVCIEQLSF